jgi:hypothetical protein
MWYLIQAAIVFAVMASNVHWHWTPNSLLASVIGFAAAWLVTWLFIGWSPRGYAVAGVGACVALVGLAALK